MKTTIESTKELISEKKAPDGRTKSTSSIYCKWETKYPWAYFNHSKNGWFCKTCEEYSNTGDAHWKTLPRKHDEHPSQFFFDHENSSKHLNSIKNKREILNVISKGTIVHQMVAGAETQSNASRDRKHWLIGKFIKTTYFLTRKKWAVKFKFKDVIDFLDDIGDPDIKYHLRNAPQNSTYTSTFAVEEFLKLMGDHLASIMLRDLDTSMDFTIIADESTDDGDRSQLTVFVRIIGSNHRPVEHFLGITRIAISKSAAAIMDIISKFLISQEIQPYYIRFCGLDGTNSMSSERCGLQRLIKHYSPHAEYINCHNHRLALCFIRLLKEFPSLVSLDTMLLSVWKLFKHSAIKKEVFNDMQRVYELTPIKSY